MALDQQPTPGSTGARLRALRELADLTQDQVAAELDVHQTAVSAWERGTATPSAAVLLRLAEFYDTTTDYLLGRECA